MKYFFYILLLCCPLLMQAQQPYAWQLTDDDGLPTMVVYDLYQDTKGAMWIATDAGICRYNGRTIEQFSNPNQKGTAMTRIKEDAQGQIWCKNFNGQFFFIKDEKMNLFAIPDSLELSSYSLHEIIQNQIWFNAKQGMLGYHLKQQKWQFWKSEQEGILTRVVGSMVSGWNQLWIVSTQGQLFQENNGHWYSKNTLSKAIDPLKIQLYAKDSFVVFSRTSAYLSSVKGAHLLQPNDAFVDNISIIDIYILKKPNNQQQVAVLTANGLLIFEPNDKGILTQVHHLLKGVQVSSVVLDREGNYWVGTLNNGVYIFPNLGIVYYNNENSNLANHHINDLTKDDHDNLLLALGNGSVAQFSTKTNQVEKEYLGDKLSNVTCVLFAAKEKKILFFNKGLYVTDLLTNQTKFYTSNIGGHQMAIFRDSLLVSGNYILSTILDLKPKVAIKAVDFNPAWNAFPRIIKEIPYPLLYIEIRTRRTNAIHTDIQSSDKFWIGYDDSLICYNKQHSQAILNKEGAPITSFDLAQSDDGVLWVATVSNGIYGIKDNKVAYHYSIQDGLPSNTCYSITCDEHFVWGGTNKGVFKLNRKDNSILVFNKLDGLISEDSRDLVIANNRVWIANSKGLISFDKNLNNINQQKPLVRIKGVWVNETTVNPTELIELSNHQNNLKFEFEGINFASRGKFQYHYRLLGTDSLWNKLEGAVSSIRFQALGAGKYTFQLRGENEDGILGDIIEYQFVILMPYWKRWWFQLGIYLFIAGIVALILTLRNFSKQKQNQLNWQMSQLRMQALQAQLNPHFVFNSLNAIQSYWVHKQTREAMSYHSKFAKLMRSIFDYSEQLTIDIEAEIEFLQMYISLEKLRFEDKIDVQFIVDEETDEVFIPPLLIQPLIENSFKHGFLHQKEKGHLLIHFKIEHNYLHVLIQDNGVGRAVATQNQELILQKKDRRSSMAIIKERLMMLNQLYGKNKTLQTLQIIDLKDKNDQAVGTNVEIWIPLLKKQTSNVPQ